MTVISLISPPCFTFLIQFVHSTEMSRCSFENFRYEKFRNFSPPGSFQTITESTTFHQFLNFGPNLTKIVPTTSCAVLAQFGSLFENWRPGCQISSLSRILHFWQNHPRVTKISTGAIFASIRQKSAARRAGSVLDKENVA